VSSTVLGPLPHALRERACGILGHTPAAELNLPGCPLPDADLVEQLCDRVEALNRQLAIADSREERR
jgi:hypothetical protein